MRIKVDLEQAGIAKDYAKSNYKIAEDINAYLKKDEEDYTGWVNWPSEIPEEWMNKMESVAEDIRSKCDRLIVIGIGGSYLGTAAIIDALGGSKPGCPEVIYAGNNMS